MTAFKRLLNQLYRDKKLVEPTVEATVARVSPFLHSYDSNTFEYSDYPATLSLSVISVDRREASASVMPTNEQINVSRIEAMAANDAEYVLLKTILSYAESNPVAMHAAAHKWKRVLCSMREEGMLTSLESTILEYLQIGDAGLRDQVETGLQRLLYCLMEIRHLDGKDLMLHKGYNPTEFQTGNLVGEGMDVSA